MKMDKIEKRSQLGRDTGVRASTKKGWVKVCIVLLSLLLMPAVSFAAKQRYVLEFGDTYIRSYNREPATIFLKRTLKEQYPEANIRNMDLRKVVLVAKTKKGRGGAELRVGQKRTDNYRVYGTPWEFHDQHRFTFDRVRFHNPSYNSRGPWQIDLWGRFVVRKIVLVVEEQGDFRPHRKKYRRRDWR